MSVRVLHGDMLDLLPTLDADSLDACVTDLAAGTAAEHIVCADLLLAGYRAFRADQNCPYDVAVEHLGRLVRVQVKATRLARPTPGRVNGALAYMWHVRRAGKSGRRRYSEREFDILALVALDIRRVAYVPITAAVLQTVHLRPPGSPKDHPRRKRQNVDDYPFVGALVALTDG